ncbi:MAG TPA: aldo/keto reductase [Candidatus Binatia bacterium]|jgi:L-galactose dehydrogenase/L-glyceraldehyde 3-phosphate reductase|nr:aldo/keto reductase [Candidatus Binatia bacterium]
MQYRTIGKTGVRVSEIGFGCGNNAVLMVKAPYDEQVKAVRHALDRGINFFDTAFAYGLGKSEENLGRILNELGANPVISTKIRLEADAVGDVKGATIRAVEAGLARLKRDRVDFVQLHTRVTLERGIGKRFSLAPKDVLGPNGVIDGFKTVRDRGKVGHFGFSGLGDPNALHELADSGEFHGFQCYYNLLNPSAGQPVPAGFSALDYGLILDHAAAKGMGAFVIRALAAGALTSDPSTGGGGSGQTLSPGSDYPVDLQRAEKIKAALNVEGRDLTQAAIRFGLMNQKVSVVLVGFSNTTHIDEAVACSGMPGLSDEQMAKVRKLWETDFEQVV